MRDATAFRLAAGLTCGGEHAMLREWIANGFPAPEYRRLQRHYWLRSGQMYRYLAGHPQVERRSQGDYLLDGVPWEHHASDLAATLTLQQAQRYFQDLTHHDRKL